MSSKAEPRSGGLGKSVVVIALTLGIGYLMLADLFNRLLPGGASASPRRDAEDGSAGAGGGTRHRSGSALPRSAVSALQPWLDLPSPQLEVPECNVEGNEWPSFLEIVKNSETDKAPSLRTGNARPHLYHTAYQKYFGPLRNRAVRLLEIGIGCGQRFVGASIPVWREYLPCVHLTMFEYQRECAEKYRAQVDELVVGDQSKTQDLDRALELGPFHLIVDDGGHTMRQQIVSLRHLLPSLPPGGIYVMEDMQTSVIGDPGYIDMPKGFTALRFVAEVIAQMHMRADMEGAMEGSGEVARLTLSVDCIREACVFVRNDEKA